MTNANHQTLKANRCRTCGHEIEKSKLDPTIFIRKISRHDVCEGLCLTTGVAEPFVVAPIPSATDAIINRLEEAELESSWPKWVAQVERYEDMTPTGKLTMIRQQDGDVILVAMGEDFQQVALEFCTPMTGGGSSEHTHKALCALMVAMEKDNVERKQNREARHER